MGGKKESVRCLLVWRWSEADGWSDGTKDASTDRGPGWRCEGYVSRAFLEPGAADVKKVEGRRATKEQRQGNKLKEKERRDNQPSGLIAIRD
jgi:hypothetical protein